MQHCSLTVSDRALSKRFVKNYIFRFFSVSKQFYDKSHYFFKEKSWHFKKKSLHLRFAHPKVITFEICTPKSHYILRFPHPEVMTFWDFRTLIQWLLEICAPWFWALRTWFEIRTPWDKPRHPTVRYLEAGISALTFCDSQYFLQYHYAMHIIVSDNFLR